MKSIIKYIAIFIQVTWIDSQGIEDLFNSLQNGYDNVYLNNPQVLERIDFVKENYNEHPINNEHFDFIIIGAGTAGSVLANRLSEMKHWKVLVIEAGGEPPVLTDLGALQLPYSVTNITWDYVYEPEPRSAYGIVERRMASPIGKVLGGTSVINNMLAVRGNKYDFENWKAMGNPGWGYEDVLPYFKKLETANVNLQDDRYRGNYGPVNVNNMQFSFGTVDKFIKAYKELGLRHLDYNGESQLGVAAVQVTQRYGLRVSAEKAYLREAKNRRNLKILTHSQVVKIHISNCKPSKAIGIRYVRDGKYYNAYVNKEVILSAGAMISPQLLLLSGIGPKGQLEKFGIEVIKDLPVGQLFYDHIGFLGLALEFNGELFPEPDYEKQFKSLIKTGESILSDALAEAFAFINTGVDKRRLPEHPDVEIILNGGGIKAGQSEILALAYRLKDDFRDRWMKPLESIRHWLVIPMYTNPESVGRIELGSGDPFDPPKIYGNFLTAERDVEAYIIAIRRIIELTETDVGKKMGMRLYENPVPGCENIRFNTDEYWECAVRTVSVTLHHQTTSVKMGPVWDSKAVVDHRARVYGIDGLRVADASIIPLSLLCHTSIPAYMVGEKVSDLIKEDWREY